MSPELLAGLNEAQSRAVTAEAEPLCILAGAGSGKTRVLTRRIAYRAAVGTAAPEHVLALTFTRRAASELSSRLARLGLRDRVAAGTFHALAYAQLRRRWADQGERPPALLDRKLRLLFPLLPGRRDATVQPADVATEIEWAKARMIAPSAYAEAAAAAGRRPPLAGDSMAAIFDRYEKEKEKRCLVDFDDLLLLCATAIETQPAFAAAQRWRFRHILVDEFQDVNPLQFRLLEAWRGKRPGLCVVGDPNQAIYAWNGADAGFLTDFARRFPGATCVSLDDNYRSSPQVLAVANSVLESGGAGARLLRPNSADGPVPTVRSYPTERDEAKALAGALRRRSADGWSRLAVLTRTHAQLVVLEEALRAAAVPYRLRGSATFLARPEVVEALAILEGAAGSLLSVALPDIDDMSSGAGTGNTGAADERQASLRELRRLADEHLAADDQATVAGFVGWLRTTLRAEEPAPGGDVVELATFHAAKGLEWDVVFLAGLEHGLMPIGRAETPEAKAEERRLLYVAATRARRELHCSWAERRTFGSRAMSRSPSPYLATIEAVARDIREGGTGAGWKRFVDEGRTALAGSGGGRRPTVRAGAHADPGVLQALKSWRATMARASGVPAFVVFHDTTLAAVAEARPQDRAALLALPGVGPVKAERYGEALLAVVATATG
ncbi:MAG: ATP-dependent helicase [Acidimicrobiales bacterium]